MSITLAVLIVTAYLVGSIPTGVWLARWKGLPDPRTSGSGNIGATNVARTLGKRMGVLTLCGDVVKGAAPVIAGRLADLGSTSLSAVAAAAVLGHVASVFLRLRGGKGVATALGAFLALTPLAALAAVVVFALSFGVTRIVSLSSILATAALPVVLVSHPSTRPVALSAVLVAFVIVARHGANIGRLVRGDEPRWARSAQRRDA